MSVTINQSGTTDTFLPVTTLGGTTHRLCSAVPLRHNGVRDRLGGASCVLLLWLALPWTVALPG
jgi:hypothetical protein